MHQKWRNQLKKAEKSPLVILNQALNPHKHMWFLDAEQRQQKARGYKNYPAPVLLAFAAANKGQARLFSAVIAGKPVAAMLVFKHGRMATYQAGVTTPDGRTHCAHNLILWHILCELNKRGIEQLDLGRADLSDGLTRFKLGAGARIETTGEEAISSRISSSAAHLSRSVQRLHSKRRWVDPKTRSGSHSGRGGSRHRHRDVR